VHVQNDEGFSALADAGVSFYESVLNEEDEEGWRLAFTDDDSPEASPD
jgi:hypothetical protein